MPGNEIEKDVVLRATPERVWRALTDSQEFGRWFGMKLEGPFLRGQWVRGALVPTEVDPEVAKTQEPHRGAPVLLYVERWEPPHWFAYRWHPLPLAPGADPTTEPTTLVTFHLQADPEGTRLTVTESGFDLLASPRAPETRSSHEGGWTAQMRLISGYLVAHP